MKNTFVWVSTLIIGIGALALWFVISQNQEVEVVEQEAHALEVAATIFPVADLVEQVAGDDVVVRQLLPSGASPHLFQFSPKQIAQLQNVDLVFGIGHGIDNWTEQLTETINAKFITLDNGVTVREIQTHEDEHDDHNDEHGHDSDAHDHGPTDPHYWLNPFNIEPMIATIVAELSVRDPEHAQEYETRAHAYVQNQLLPAIQELQTVAQRGEQQRVIALHDAWYYFADAFGVEIIGVFEPAAAEEPSPRYLAELAHAIEDYEAHGEPITALWAEPQLSTNALEAFSRDHNVPVVLVDPIGGVEGRMSYIDLVRYNIRTIFGE